MKEITSAFTCLACKACPDTCTHLHCVLAQVSAGLCTADFACEVRQDFVPQVQVKLSMQVPFWGSYFILGPKE